MMVFLKQRHHTRTFRKTNSEKGKPRPPHKTIYQGRKYGMQPKRSLIYILAALITLPFFGTVAPATTIDVFQTFDIATDGSSTLPQKISDQTDLIGTTISAVNGNVKAFVYKVKKQKFSLPFSPPFDTGSITNGRGINNKRHACGEYMNGSDSTFHGFLLVSGEHNELIFSQFDLTSSLDTLPLGINNFGSLAGAAIFGDGSQPAFISVHGVVTTFAVPDATATFAYQLNSTNQVIGYYLDSIGIPHGYARDSAGVLTYPIDVPGAAGTLLLGNNDSNWVVGRYMDTAGVIHGLFYVTPDNILTYDYPGATYTSLNGINKDGLICGYYGDAAGVSHGFVARVNLTNSGKPHTNRQGAPVKPAYELPQVAGIAMPAL